MLVGRNGAGPHDLRRNGEQGQVYWDAAPSQYYAEPKRLEAMGLLTSTKQPGVTRERTHYMLTEAGRAALEEWVRTPAPLPRFQHESVVRLMSADLVDPEAVLEGLEGMQAAIDEVAAHLEAAAPGQAALTHRSDLLEANRIYAERLLDLQREWLAEARRVLARRISPAARSPA
jgi:DNA-binding PadR family transcriptional regulator